MNKVGLLLKMGTKIFLLLLWANLSFAGVVFEENFDTHQDWHSGLSENDLPYEGGSPDRGQSSFNGATLPDGWFSIRQEAQWAASKGYPGGHETIELLGSNTDKARGGSGKSLVKWRDSIDLGPSYWSSDGLVLFHLPNMPGVPEGGLKEVYVEFYITFSDKTVASYYSDRFGATKLFRLLHWTGSKPNLYSYFDRNENKPTFGWQGGSSSLKYGYRNFLLLKGLGGNMNASKMSGLPSGTQLLNGELSLPFSSSSLRGMGIRGTDTQLKDKKNGGVITKGPVAIDQVFGDETVWTKVGFYAKMNSAPGVHDGVAMQWIDNKRIFINETVAWIQPGAPMVKWNILGLGGNDRLFVRPDHEHYQEWYAIDDLVVRDDIPEYLQVGQVSPPSPPLLDVN